MPDGPSFLLDAPARWWYLSRCPGGFAYPFPLSDSFTADLGPVQGTSNDLVA